MNVTTDSFTAGAPAADMSSVLDFTMNSPPGSPSFLATPSGSASTSRLQVEPDEDYEKGDSIYKQDSINSDDEQEEGNDEESPFTWSIHGAERFIDKQTHLLQVNESKAMAPRLLQEVLQAILASYPHLSAAYYLSCLNYLRVKEARLSVESLTSAYDTQQVRASPNWMIISHGILSS